MTDSPTTETKNVEAATVSSGEPVKVHAPSDNKEDQSKTQGPDEKPADQTDTAKK